MYTKVFDNKEMKRLRQNDLIYYNACTQNHWAFVSYFIQYIINHKTINTYGVS